MATFILVNKQLEDEAEVHALEFVVNGDKATVTAKYPGYPEWEVSKTLPLVEARKIWRENTTGFGRFEWDGKTR